MKPIVWRDTDYREVSRRKHRMQVELARSANRRGNTELALWHLKNAARQRVFHAADLREFREKNIRFFDPVAFVNSGGFNLREI
jgi:hypothetical protein